MIHGDPLVKLQRGEATDGPDFVATIAALIRETKFRFRSEAELHQGLAFAFATANLQVSQEVPLTPGSRIDFCLTQPNGRGGLRAYVGVEVKVKGSTPRVREQLERYAATGRLDSIILITSRAKHRSLDGLELPGPDGHIRVTVARLPWLQ